VDVRVIAATHRSLAADVDAGRFRPDLYARLRGFVFETSSLSDRLPDLGIIAARYVPRGIRLSARAVRDLLAYDWPYNIRELRQLIEVSSALAKDGVIASWHGIPSTDVDAAPAEERGSNEDDDRLRTVLLAQLREHRGNVAAVARAMKKAPMQIRRWMKRFGIELEGFRG
jgi:transcriptional regulator of acetoin/glycerol metabolism